MTYDRKIYFPDEPMRADEQPAKVQKWKTDPSLNNCEREANDLQSKKLLDYEKVYVEEFLNSDPLRDWESIERCIELWMFFLNKIEIDILKVQTSNWSILDCGSKDGQFPEWLNRQAIEVLGIELSSDYVKWAQNHNRPVEYGDVCDMPPKWTNKFDVVFSHHLLGLTSDYWLGMSEMLRVTKPGGYMVTLNDVPGNPRKHFSYINNSDIFDEFTKSKKCDMVYNNHWNRERTKEWVYIIQKEK